MKKCDSLLFVIFATLLFFPSVTFGVLEAEVFPWGILFSLFYLRSVNYCQLLIFAALTLSSIWVGYISAFGLSALETDIVRSLGAYLNSLGVFFALMCASNENIQTVKRLAKSIFLGLIFLGFGQVIGVGFLSGIFEFLVPRATGESMLASGRGVTLLASEPARAGVELTLIYILTRGVLNNGVRAVFLDFLIFLYIVIVIQSASAVAFAFGSFIIIYLVDYARVKYIPHLAIIIVTCVVFFIFFLPHIEGRAGRLANELVGLTSLSEAIYHVANESGNRIVGIYAFTISAVENPFGSGVGTWPSASVAAMLNSGLDISSFRFFDVHGNGNVVPFRGPGILSNLALDFGLIGTLILSMLFVGSISRQRSLIGHSPAIWMIFIFKIALFGSPGNPIVFVFLAVALRCMGWSTSNHENLGIEKVVWKKG